MKTKTTMKHIINTYDNVYCCGYCDLQYIMRGVEPQYYNCGVYGGQMIPKEIIDKYSKIAEELSKDWTKSYDETFEALEANRENFWEAVANI